MKSEVGSVEISRKMLLQNFQLSQLNFSIPALFSELFDLQASFINFAFIQKNINPSRMISEPKICNRINSEALLMQVQINYF